MYLGCLSKPKTDKPEAKPPSHENRFPFPYEESSPVEESYFNEDPYFHQPNDKSKNYSMNKNAFMYENWDKYNSRSVQSSNNNNINRAMLDSVSHSSKMHWKSNILWVNNLEGSKSKPNSSKSEQRSRKQNNNRDRKSMALK